MKRMIGTVSLLIVASSAAYALEDTPQSRTEQANRYLKAVPMKDALRQTMAPIFQGDPAGAQNMEAMFKHLDYVALDNAVRGALVKTFTADELAALADLYNSSAGKSAIEKMGLVMAKAMPMMMPEYAKAHAEAMRELAAQPKQ